MTLLTALHAAPGREKMNERREEKKGLEEREQEVGG